MKNYRGFLIVCGVSFLGGMLYYSTLILWPLQIETFYATDPVKVGLYSMAFSGGGMIGAFASASILERVDQARWILTCICSLATVLCGAQAIVGRSDY
jgi:MFS family permease